MNLLCLGLDHTTAPLSLRERVAFNEETARAALARLGCGSLNTPLGEMVILSTCNRVELYAVSSEPTFEALETFLFETRRLQVEEYATHFYRYHGEQVVRHLFRVAAGLESQVLGEPQILGQVTRALEIARAVGASGPLLNRLFQDAIHAAKRVHTETAISRNPTSISSLAAAWIERIFQPIEQAQIVILGAGEMAELAIEALRRRGAHRILVLNRTLERAQALAARWNAEASTFEALESALERADILITSTAAPHILLPAPMVEKALKQRPTRPLILIDIALPRNIDPACAALPGVYFYDLDSLEARLENSLAERLSQVPLAEQILEEEIQTFLEYLRSLDVIPLIAELRRQAEAIRRAELEKTLRRLPDLSESERLRIEALTQAIVNKLLDAPIRTLRDPALAPQLPQYAAVTRHIFRLELDSSHPSRS
ncbi:MAG: glutamyl-tRNA reductase [Anaerolineales bacterium]